LGVLETEFFHLLAAEGADGDANVLQVLLALLRSDDDLFHNIRDREARGAGERNGGGDNARLE